MYGFTTVYPLASDKFDSVIINLVDSEGVAR